MNEDDYNLSKELILSPLRVVPEIDKFCMWMLAGTGATTALLVSNLESIVNTTQDGLISWFFTILAISGLFGFLSKLCCIRAQSSHLILGHIEIALERNKNSDIDSALKEYFSVFPIWVRFFAKRASNKGRKDALYGYRILARLAIYQGIWAVCQGLTFISFIVVAAIGLK